MLTVIHDLPSVESNLNGGRLVCPACSGRLAPWGWARHRFIRDGTGPEQTQLSVRPRRARCDGCRVTHVLLDDRLALRRADSARAIAEAIELKAGHGHGYGHRQIAARLGRPVTTVRGWLRAFAVSAARIMQWFTGLTRRDAVDAAVLWPKPAPTAVGGALSAVIAYAKAVQGRFKPVVVVAWQTVGLTVSNGRLFSASFWVDAVQHEPALMPRTHPPET